MVSTTVLETRPAVEVHKPMLVIFRQAFERRQRRNAHGRTVSALSNLSDAQIDGCCALHEWQLSRKRLITRQ